MNAALVTCSVLVVLARLIWPARAALDPSRAPASPVEDPAPTAVDIADALILLGLALRGGRSPVDALDDVADRVGGAVGRDVASVAAAHRWGIVGAEAWRSMPEAWAPAATAWTAAERAGVSAGPLLDRASVSIRARAAADRESALQRSAVLLVLPLGFAFLPGFVLTTVAPTVWRLLPTLLAR